MPLRVVIWMGVVCALGVFAPRAAHAQTTRSLSGVVIDADTGTGITGANIVIKDAAAPTAAAALLTSGADGSFTLAKVPVGDLVVQVTANDYAPASLPVKAGKAATSVVVSLRKAAPSKPGPTRTVVGIVRDAKTGVGIANARVEVVGTGKFNLADADGVFTLTDVSSADVALQVSADTYGATSIAVQADAGLVKVALEPTTAQAPPPGAPTTRSIRGKLTEQLSGDPVVGATVTVAGTTNATFSDEKGEFQLSGLPQTDAVLEVEADGYRPLKVTALATSTEVLGILEFLASEQIILEGRSPVIVRQNLAHGASVVGDADLNRVSAPTIESAMTAKVSGANLQSNSGAPGGGTQLRLRGISTVNGQSSPLYVIDGVVLSNVAIPSGVNAITAAAAGGSASNQDNPVNRIADLNPNDIESVEVLKGASAAALYGSKAANGVVIIRTKRGKGGGATRVSVTQRVGFSQVTNTLGSRKFNSPEEVMAAYDSAELASLYTPNVYDHEDQLSQTSLGYETIGMAAGGTDKASYYGSVLVRDEPGVVVGTFYEKQTGRIGIGYQFGDRVTLELGGSLLHSLSDRGLTNNDNTGTSYYVALSSTPSFFDLRRQPDGLFPENAFAGSNPLQTVALFQNREDVWRLIGSANAAVQVWKGPLDDVKLLGNFGVDRFSIRHDVFAPPLLQFEPSDGLPGTAIEGSTNNLNYNIGVGALWRRTPASGKWKSALSGGVTFESVDLLSVYLVGGDLSQPNVDTATSLQAQETALRTKDQGIYLQEEVALLEDRLSVLAGVLGERSSLNGDTAKFFVYPKIAATYAFEVPEETFDLVRARAAYGEAGNRPNYGQKFTALNANLTIERIPSLTNLGVIGDPDIEPERQREIEVGTDVALKDQRAVLELTVYQRMISNLLLQEALPPSSGSTTRFINGGSLRNRGVEAAVQYTPFDENQEVSWTTRGILTLNRSMVTSLPGPAFNVTTVGFGAGLGAFRLEEGRSATRIVSDWDGDGILNTVGNGEPDFRVGWANKVNWRELELNTLLDWQRGSDVINLTRLLYDFGQVSPDYVPWGQMRLAAFEAGDIRPYVEDASFVKLREVSLAYAVPESFTKQLLLATLRVSVSGRNLWTWSTYSGLDPEVSNFGNQPIGRNYDVAPYPPSRSVWLSVEAGL